MPVREESLTRILSHLVDNEQESPGNNEITLVRGGPEQHFLIGRADLKKLFRSTTDKHLAGVCGGLGEIFEIDPNIFRLAAVFLGLATGIFPLLVTYLVAWFVVPKGP